MQQEQNNDSVGYTTISKTGALKNAAAMAATLLTTGVCLQAWGSFPHGAAGGLPLTQIVNSCRQCYQYP
ncbi:MAG: hypothetical protein IPK17_29920 [Chloroflexi bacterium]|uniref:hypothetical protein n=1 Tax=Candidatus Flexifilum breve TaxID=3140694 RepID=UPI0031349C0F|nr:hypothetical protein [Chloroflexota bacterium]